MPVQLRPWILVQQSSSSALRAPERLAALRRSGLLDTLPEESFDRLTRLASRFLGAPVALVVLLDENRQFFKSAVGLGEPWASKREMPVAYSYCHHALESSDPLVIEDARLDPRTRDSPAIAENFSLAYAGVPLTAEGQVLGTLCVVDTKPRRWTEDEIRTLRDLAASAQTEIDLRREAARRAEQVTLLHATHDSIIVRDMEDRITFWNRGAERRYGWSSEEAEGRISHDLLGTRFAVPLEQIQADLLREGRWEGDLVQITREGQEIVVASRWVLQFAERAERVSVLEINHDVTEQRQAESRLRQSEERFRALFDQTAASVLIHDAKGRILQVNRRLCERLGYTRDELLSLPVSGIEVEHREDELRPLWEQMRLGVPVTVEGTHRRKDGSIFPVEVQVTKIELDDQQAILVEAQDITGRRETQEALGRSEAKFRSLIENASEVITILNAEGTIRYESPTVERLLGYPPHTLEGRTFFEFMHPQDVEPMGKLFQGVLQSRGEPVPYLFRFRHGGGSHRWLEGVATNLLDDPAVGGVVANSRDVTERIETEQKLETYSRELERSNRELEDFAHIASHDLQEPLRKVQAFGDRLKGRYAEALDETGRDYLERMQHAASRMQVLIEDLLAYSRVTSKAQPFERIDLREVAVAVVGDLSTRVERTGARVTLGALPEVEADPLQMRQLFQNLIGNALKFHRDDVPPVVTTSGEARDGFAEIRVADNGIGFEMEYAERMFRPFERLHGRLKYEGTGMGLAIVRKIVERHGGSIRAESAPGEGATLVVRLPLRQNPTEEL